MRRVAGVEVPQALPLHRGPPRAPRRRRQRTRSTTTSSPPTPTSKGRLLALDAVITIDGGAYSDWPFTIGLEPGQATGNLPGPYDFRGYRVKTYCVATNKPGFLPYRGVARTGVCFAMDLLIDAVARAVDREPWEVRMENLVPTEAMPYNNVARKHFDSGDYPRSLLAAKEKIGFADWRKRQREGPMEDGRLIGIGFASYCEQSAHGTSVFAAWGLPIVPGYDQAAVRVTPDGGLEVRVGVHSHGQGMETTLGADRQRGAGHSGRAGAGGARRHRHHAILDRHLCVAQHRHGRRRGGQCLPRTCQALRPHRRAPHGLRRERGALRRRPHRRPERFAHRRRYRLGLVQAPGQAAEGRRHRAVSK